MIVAEDLAEKEGKGDQRTEDSIAGFANLLSNDLGDPLGRGDLAEGQLQVKDQGAEQGPKLSGSFGACMIAHDRPSLAVESGPIPSIDLAQGLSSASHFEKKRYGSVSAIHPKLRLDARRFARQKSAKDDREMGVPIVREPGGMV
jgi:hypothetical protein